MPLAVSSVEAESRSIRLLAEQQAEADRLAPPTDAKPKDEPTDGKEEESGADASDDVRDLE